MELGEPSWPTRALPLFSLLASWASHRPCSSCLVYAPSAVEAQEKVSTNEDVVAVIPAHNCGSSIGAVVRGTLRHTSRVVVWNDGSDDDTAKNAEEAGANVLCGEKNRGKGYALRKGIDAAMSDRPAALILLDGDGQHDPEDIPAMRQAWDQGEGNLIIGSRLDDAEKIPPARYWANFVGSRILSWMTRIELLDSQSGFRLLGADLVHRLDLQSNGFEIETEMLLKASKLGARVSHVPVRTIYDTERSHFRPVTDTVRISLWAVYFKFRPTG